jgi:hypothetical protein
MVFPLLKRWVYASTSIESSKGSAGASFPLHDFDVSAGSKLKSIGSSKMRSSSKKRIDAILHPLSIPNDTAWGSDEAIVTMNKECATSRGDCEDVMETSMDQGTRFAVERGSKGIGKRESTVMGRDIMMTREWKVSGE